MINDTINMENENEKKIELFMTEIIISVLSKISLSILKKISKFMSGWAKKKFLSIIKIEIESKMNLNFSTESNPAAWLKFEGRNYSYFDLTPKNIHARVILGGETKGHISWSRQEDIFIKSSEIGLCHIIPDLPSISNLPTTISHIFQIYYPLPMYTDFGKKELCLLGTITFDCVFGTVVKYFQTSCNLSEDKWSEALNKWQKDLKGKRTIAVMNNYQPYPLQKEWWDSD